MDRETELRLLDECVANARGRPPAGDDAERLVPVAEYTDAARFGRERDVLFRASLNLVAHQSELASAGAFLTRELVGAPVLLTRGEDGRARAFLNVCRHRGATVELRERGQCSRLVCPYHAWTYRLDGTLASARHRHGFPSLDVERTRLVELPCAEAAGFLWVCPTPRAGDDEADPLGDASTRALLDELTAFGITSCVVFAVERRVWRANWKLIVDGGLESYHFRVAHRETVGGYFKDTGSTFERLGDHFRLVLPRVDIEALASAPRERWSIREASHVLYSVFPNASVLVQERHFDVITVTPLTPDQTLIEVSTLVPDPGAQGFSERARGFWAANHEFTKKTLHEDWTLAEQIQRGLDAGANAHFRFATFEGALSQWHDRVDARLAAATP